MNDVLKWLKSQHDSMFRDLSQLVAIASVSTDGQHQRQIDRSAAVVRDQMRRAGLNNVKVLKPGKANPFVYGEWTDAPGQPTICSETSCGNPCPDSPLEHPNR